jgi:hemoglobin/transferrin/lactoferrin receptor protein
MVQKTSHGQGSPYIRGFTGFRTLFLVDGIRLNNSVLRDGPNQYWNTVDAFGLERLEVVKGPVSVLYGSDSIGGTVQALTRETPALGQPINGSLRLRLASAERSAGGHLEVKGAPGKRFRFNLGLSGKTFGDVEAGHAVGRQPQTGYDEKDANVKLRYLVATDTELVAAWQLTDLDDVWRTHSTVFARPSTARPIRRARGAPAEHSRPATRPARASRSIG